VVSVLKIGVLASGRGSNFQALIDATEHGALAASVELLVVDNPDAYAIERAKKHGISSMCLEPGAYESKDRFYTAIAEKLVQRKVELVVLAGFMRVVQKPLLDAFPMKVINIHPALLPSFPGLHGQSQAVEYGVRISGCTVHFVDEGVDTGPIIIQAAVPVYPDDTEETLSERILKQEHRILPEAVRLFAEGRLEIRGRRVSVRDYTQRDEVMVNPERG
jgi:phosphoribosylglycinamide formyltransferase-1